jgi:7-keto-8-aminopelargonate synthetase-like enzyme
VVRATERALAENRARGDALRRRLAENVSLFRASLRRYGMAATGGLFPVQAIAGLTGAAARAVHARLHELGVRAVLARSACSPGSRVVFVITAAHGEPAIERAAGALCRANAELGLEAPLGAEGFA